MKAIQNIGIAIFLVGLSIFAALPFIGNFKLDQSTFDEMISSQGIKSEIFVEDLKSKFVNKEFSGVQALAPLVKESKEKANAVHTKNKEWGKKVYTSSADLATSIRKNSGYGFIRENKGLMWFLTFGLGIIGALMFIVPQVVTLGKKGIKNDHIYHQNSTNRGWIAWLVFIFLVSFYLVLYFKSEYAVNWTYLVDPISESLSGNPAGHWFVYGFMYCVVMTVMAIRMYIKYRHNMYQMVRTTSVLFFQIVFAFLIPEIMVRLQLSYSKGYDFKNAFPLDYDFFFNWNYRK